MTSFHDFFSKKLMQELYQQGLLLLTDVRNSMKRLMTQTQHELLKLRKRIESIFSCLKHLLKAEASIARSPLGYLSRCLYACLTFALSKELEAKRLT